MFLNRAAKCENLKSLFVFARFKRNFHRSHERAVLESAAFKHGHDLLIHSHHVLKTASTNALRSTDFTNLWVIVEGWKLQCWTRVGKPLRNARSKDATRLQSDHELHYVASTETINTSKITTKKGNAKLWVQR